MKKSEAKIVAVMSTLAFAQKILCIAYHEKMTFPDYQWIVVGHSHGEFTESNTTLYYDGRHYMCNWTKTTPALEKTVFIHFGLLEVNKSLTLVSGYTYQEIVQQYAERVHFINYSGMCPFTVVPNIWAATTYDSVWALVLALNKTLSVLSNTSIVSEKVDQVFVDSDTLKENFQCVSFNGASGYIHFDGKTGFVHRRIDIYQIHDGVAIPAGSISKGTVLLSDDPPPIFITIPNSQYDSVNYYLAAFFLLIETTLLIVTIFIHAMNIVNRKRPSVKASSPSLNQFVFLGCYILCVVAFVYILLIKTFRLSDFSVVGNACHVLWVWLVPIAISMSIGILIAKTWRIYRIFIHFREPGPLISNKALIMIALIQLSIDVIIGTAWTIISPIRLETVEKGSYKNRNGDTIIPRQCVFTNTEYWLVILAGYKCLQITVLFLLCVLTRSVSDKRFSTVSLSAASYMSLFMMIVFIPLYAILWYTNAEIHADFVVLCLFFSGNGLVFLVFVLLPPVLPLFPHCKWS